jgi:hypothetical protein
MHNRIEVGAIDIATANNNADSATVQRQLSKEGSRQSRGTRGLRDYLQMLVRLAHRRSHLIV